MKIKHVLASEKDKKATISKNEMSKLVDVSKIDLISLYYTNYKEIVLYKKSRNGNTWYPLSNWPKSIYLPKIGEPVFHDLCVQEDIKNENIFDLIREWAKERGIYEKGDCKTQFIKLQEESGELAKSILKNDNDEFIDAIGDCVVVLTNLAELKGIKIEDCIKSAYNTIKNRKGKMNNGTFVKEK